MDMVFRAVARLGMIGSLLIVMPYEILRFALFILIGAAVASLLKALAFSALWGPIPLDAPFMDHPIQIIAGLGVILIGLCTGFMYAYSTSPLPDMWQRRQGDSHGSARLATKKEVASLKTGNGLLVGMDNKTGEHLRYDGKAHLITFAPTRSGKGVGTVLPNLLGLERSVFVIDPKGENARIAGRCRADMGPLYVLDPFEISGIATAAYNPLSTLAPDSVDLGEDAATLADALVMDPPGQVKDAHWNEEAKALLGGLIMFCVAHEEPARRNLATVREYITLPPQKLTALLELMSESTSAHGLIARAANRHLSKPEREAGSVLSNAQRHTHFLDSPRIAKVTQQSDFSFRDLRHGLISVFLVLPPDRLDVYARWLRLLVTQALQEIARDAQSPAQGNGSNLTPETLPEDQIGAYRASQAPALFLLDEFASLGRLEAVERAMGLMAGFGLQLWPILQDMSQLKALYGERANTFIANSGVVQVFGVNDFETAKWLSQTMGQETAGYVTRSHTPGEIANVSEGVTARDLLTPDEIMQLADHLQILRVQGLPPVLCQKLVYWSDVNFAGLFDPDPQASHARSHKELADA